MNRVRLCVIVSIALAVAVLVPWLSTHAQDQGNSKVEFIHTGDWQPGDEVSFTVRGVVEDNKPEPKQGQEPKQDENAAGATLQGYVVEMEDPKGKKSRIPWTPLLHYSVPALQGPITATLIGPTGAHLGTARIPVSQAGTSIPQQLPEQPSGTLVAPPISQIGQPYRVYSPSGKLNGHGDATLIARGSHSSAPIECKALAESPHSAVFEPRGLKPGPATFTVKEAAIDSTFAVSTIGIGLDTSRLQTKGQAGALLLKVTGFPTNRDELHKLVASSHPVVTLVNETPHILAFTQHPQQITWSVQESEVRDGTWTQDIPTLARQRGQFQMTATAATPGLINPSDGAAQYIVSSSPAGPNEEHKPPKGTGYEKNNTAPPGTGAPMANPPPVPEIKRPPDVKVNPKRDPPPTCELWYTFDPKTKQLTIHWTSKNATKAKLKGTIVFPSGKSVDAPGEEWVVQTNDTKDVEPEARNYVLEVTDGGMTGTCSRMVPIPTCSNPTVTPLPTPSKYFNLHWSWSNAANYEGSWKETKLYVNNGNEGGVYVLPEGPATYNLTVKNKLLEDSRFPNGPKVEFTNQCTFETNPVYCSIGVEPGIVEATKDKPAGVTLKWTMSPPGAKAELLQSVVRKFADVKIRIQRLLLFFL